MGEAIEHFLDKSRPQYRKWAFHPLNLLYSCQPCNMVKTTADMGDINVQAANYIQPGIGAFRWLHPYFDSYKKNIRRTSGPFFSAIPSGPRYNEAVLMIKELHLNDIANRDDRYQQILVEIQRLQDLMADVALRSSTFKSQVRYANYIQAIKNRLRLHIAELS